MCPYKQSYTHQKGFTLVELLVSITIFSVITTMAVFSNSQFNSSVLLTNLAYEIAISVRQAQVYGVTVRKNASGGFDSAYGIHFDLATPSKYVLFEDKAPQDHICDSNECLQANVVEVFNIQKGNRISKICVDSTCSTSGTLDVSFVRPNPDAFIRRDGQATRYNKAEICVSSISGSKRKVVVEETGQISATQDTTNICN